MAEVGYAAVQIIPSTRGFAGALSSQLGGSMSSVGKEQGGKLGSALKVGAVAAAVGIGAAAVGITKSIQAAAELDTKFREVVTLFGETGAAADRSLGQVSGMVRKLSDEFGFAQQELTGGLYQAISAGVPRENAFTFMQVASKAAVAGVTDVETSVDGLTSIINAFGLEASDAQAVSDSMFAAVKGGKTTFEEISKAIFNVAPAAAAAKVSMQEVNASIATLTSGGTPTSVATTQIRSALVGLQRPSAEMDKIFGKLGFKNAQLAVESKGLGFALAAVTEAADGDNGALQKLLGSSEAVAAANVIAGTGAKKFAKELRAQEKAAGATGDAFDVVNEGFERQATILKTQLTNVGISIGQKLLPMANKFIGWLRSPEVAAFAGRIRDLLLPALEKIGGIAKGVFDIFAKGDFTAAFGKVSGLSEDSPLVAFLFKVREHAVELWDVFSSKILPVFADVGKFVLAKVVPAVAKLVQAVAERLSPILSAVAEFISEKFAPAFRELVDKIKRALPPVIEFVGGLIKIVAAILGKVIPVIIKVAGPIFTLLLEAIGFAIDVVGWLARVIVGTWKTIGKAFRGIGNLGKWLWEKAIRPAFKGIGKAATFMWEKVLRPAFRAIVNAFLWVAEKIIEGAAKAFGWVPGIGPKLRTAAEKFRTFRQNVNDALSGIKDKNVTVTGNLKFGGALSGKSFTEGGGANFARDLLLREADGGILENHQAQIAPAGAWRVWAEEETGGEAYIPLAQSKRGRSMGILEQVAQKFGVGLTPMKDGGLFPRVDLPGRGQIGRFAGGFDETFGALADLIRDKLDSAAERLVVSSPIGGAGGAERWRNVALQALAYTGSPLSWIGSLLRRMNQESGGNPLAINLWDSNAAAGMPSQGLMQTIPPTFFAYARELAGRGITDPFANIVASIRYANSRYGAAPVGWDQPGGYDSGGMWPSGTLGFNASGSPEAVFNDSQWKTLRAAVAPVLAGGGRRGRQRLASARVDFDPNKMEMWMRDIVVEEMADEDGHQNRFGD